MERLSEVARTGLSGELGGMGVTKMVTSRILAVQDVGGWNMTISIGIIIILFF